MKEKILNLLRKLLYPLFKDLITVYSTSIQVTDTMRNMAHEHEKDFLQSVERELIHSIANTLAKEQRLQFSQNRNVDRMTTTISAKLRIL